MLENTFPGVKTRLVYWYSQKYEQVNYEGGWRPRGGNEHKQKGAGGMGITIYGITRGHTSGPFTNVIIMGATQRDDLPKCFSMNLSLHESLSH